MRLLAFLATPITASLTTIELGNGMQTSVHQGMLRSARVLVDKLVRRGVLARAARRLGTQAAEYEFVGRHMKGSYVSLGVWPFGCIKHTDAQSQGCTRCCCHGWAGL